LPPREASSPQVYRCAHQTMVAWPDCLHQQHNQSGGEARLRLA